MAGTAESAASTAGPEELTAAQAAARYGIAARTVREWSRTGLLSGREARGGRRFPRAEVERLVRERGLDGSTAEDRAQTADATARLIDKLHGEVTVLTHRLAYTEAQRDALAGRVKQLEAPRPAATVVLPRETVPADEAAPGAEGTAPTAEGAAGGLWARVGRWWRGGRA